MTRTAQTTAKNKATKLHSELVRARGFCENCGESDPTKLQCAHIVSRRYAQTRTMLENAFCLCARCHMHFTEWPLEFSQFVESHIGEQRYDTLKALATRPEKMDWLAELERLKALKVDGDTVPSARALGAED